MVWSKNRGKIKIFSHFLKIMVQIYMVWSKNRGKMRNFAKVKKVAKPEICHFATLCHLQFSQEGIEGWQSGKVA